MKDRFFELAIKSAEKSTHPQHRLGCVLVKRGRVIKVGWNQIKTHPKSKSYGHHLHAEIHALLGVSQKDLNNAVLYVARIRRSNSLGHSRPCDVCMRVIKEAGIKAVFFFDQHGNKTSLKVS